MNSNYIYHDQAFYIVKNVNNQYSISVSPFIITPCSNKVIFQILRDIDFSFTTNHNQIINLEVYYLKHHNNKDNKLKILDYLNENKFSDQVKLFYKFTLDMSDYQDKAYINYSFQSNQLNLNIVDYNDKYYVSNPTLIITHNSITQNLDI